jgi:hypothetical protein
VGLRCGTLVGHLERRPDLREALETPGTRGVSCATHLCEICRVDGSLITPEEAETALYSFQVLSSFALGRFVAPAVPVGLDRGEAVVWEQWAPWMSSPIGSMQGWW